MLFILKHVDALYEEEEPYCFCRGQKPSEFPLNFMLGSSKNLKKAFLPY